jgi:SPP1 family predicted phage head-tail adaptor
MAGYAISVGDLRTQITFQSPTITTDAGAAQKSSFSNVATNPTVWARWINAHGQEILTGNAMSSVQLATVTVRHRTDITTKWQIVKDDGTTWQVISIDEVQDRNRWIEMVVERAAGSL